MKNHLNNFGIFLCFIFLASGCNDILEKDITDLKINLISPADSVVSSSSTIQFLWSAIEGADGYNLKLTRLPQPGLQVLQYDTNLIGSTFTVALLPGKYLWSVSAFNNAYSTQYTTHYFEIDSSLNLTNEQIILLNPLDLIYTNSDSIKFNWASLYNSDYYHLKIENSLTFVQYFDTLISANAITIVGLPEGKLNWKVRGENSISFTSYFHRQVIVDRTSPNSPLNYLPQYGSTVQLNDSLSWIHSTDVLFDSIFVSIDSTFVSVNQAAKVFSEYFQIANLTNGNYYWKVNSFDSALNKSSTIVSKFTLQ